MRDIAVLTFVTLDGVMQAPSMPDEDRSNDFESGGWAGPYWQEAMTQVQREAMSDPYDMLFGRKTYELFAGHWPQVDNDPTAERMNQARKFVVTSTLTDLGWANSRSIKGDVTKEITKLKAEDGPLLQIHGSWQLIQHLLTHNLIDVFRIWTFPIFVGRGKRLFETTCTPSKLDLIKSEACSNGVVMSIYQRT